MYIYVRPHMFCNKIQNV